MIARRIDRDAANDNYRALALYLDKKTEITDAHGLADRHRQALLAVIKMREVLAQETGPDQSGPELKYSIDTKGTVIFRLAGRGTIRDTGLEIHFSVSSDQTTDLARKYAAAKWGNFVELGRTTIKFHPPISPVQENRR